MAFCNIEQKNKKGLLDYVTKDIANKRLSEQQYDIKQTMSELYTELIEAGSAPDRALTLVSLVPDAALTNIISFPEVAEYLAPAAGIVAIMSAKSKDFENLISALDLSTTFDERLKDAAQIQEPVEEGEASLPGIENSLIIDQTPVVSSGLSTTGLEKGVTDDPAVQANGAFIRKFIKQGERSSKNVSEGFVLSKIGLYRLALVHGSKIPEESRVNGDFYAGAVYAFINENGQTITDENGHMPHSFLRAVDKTETGYSFKTSESSKRLKANKENAQRAGVTVNELKALLNNEAKFLYESSKRLSEDTSLIIPLDAQRGTLGVIAGAKNIRINQVVDFQEEFLLPSGVGSGTGRIETVTKNQKPVQAFVFNHPSYDYTLVADPIRIVDSSYATAVKEILLSKELTNAQKKNLLFNIIQSPRDISNNKITLTRVTYDSSLKKNTYKRETLDLNNLEAAENLVDNYISNQYLNMPIAANQILEFDAPVKKGDSYEVGTVKLYKYVYDNFKVNASLNTDGSLLTPHPVIYFKAPLEEQLSNESLDLSNESAEVLKEIEELKTENAEGSIDLDTLLNSLPEGKDVNLDEVFGRKRTGLNKTKQLSSEATEKEIAAAKEWYNNSPLSKVIPLETWFGIVNSGKIAEFTANGIKLYAGSNYTDLYHEGWHGFSQLFLSKAEKVALYKEVRKIHGNISFLQAEEILAEDFRKYRLSNGTKVLGKNPAQRSIFKKIFDFLKALFGNMETKVQYSEMVAQENALEIIKQSYEVLYKGEFEDLTASIDNSFFLTLNKGVEGKDGTVLSAKDSKDVSDAIDSIVANTIKEYGSSPKEVLNKKDALTKLYEEVYTTLKSKFVELKDAGKIQEAIALGTAISNYGDPSNLKNNSQNTLLGYHFKASRYLQSLAKSQDITELLDLDIVDSIDDYMEYYDKSGNELSIKDLADNSVLYAVRSMREFDRSGSVVKDRFGFDKLADFGKSFNRISTLLRDTTNLADMLKVLNDESQKDTKFKDLIAQLGKAVESKDDYKWQMQTSFWQSFNKAFIPINVAYVRTVIDKNQTVTELNFRVKRAEGEVNSVQKELLRKFQASAGLENTTLFGQSLLLNVSSVLKNYKGINATNVVQFYQDMGVLPATLENSFIAWLSGDLVTIANTQSMVTSLKQLAAQSEKDILESNPISFLSKDNKSYRGRSSTLNLIVEQYGSSVGDTGSGRKLTAERTTQHESSLNNSATRIVQALNKVEKLDDLLLSSATQHLHPNNNPRMLSNPIMNALFIMDDAVGYGSKRGNTLRLFNISGVTTETIIEGGPTSITGKKNISLDEYSKLNQDVHTLFLGGYVENVRNSDKTTSYAWKIEGQEPSITPADVINNSYLTKATKGVLQLLAGELATMKRYSNTDINAFDAKGNPIELDTWQSFKSDLIIDKQAKSDLIKNYVLNDKVSESDIYGLLLNSDESIRTSIQEGIERMLSQEVAKLDEIINTNKELTDNKLAGLILSKELRASVSKYTGSVSREELTKAVKKAFVIESFIRNAAYFDIANLGVASYRSADDIVKRNTTTSTGNIFRTDAAAKEYITGKGRLLENKYARETGKPVMQRQYTGELRTAILKEVVINAKELKSEWYNKAVESFKKEGYTDEQISNALKAYTEMDEADAQAYLNMDTYRQLSIASDQWTSEQEYIYQKLVAGESIENPIQYFPVRKYQYTGPLLNANAPLQALHKYSLVPLLPSVIEGTNLGELSNAMMEAGIDYVTYETGNKAARVGKPVDAFKIDAETGSRSVADNLVEQLKQGLNVIHVDYLKDQLLINNAFKGSASFSTQFRKLLADGIYENGKAVNKELAKSSERFLKSVDNLINFETEKLENEIKSKKDLVTLIKSELERRDVADYKIEAIDIDDNGNLKYNLDALPSASEMEKIINALVNRRLVKTKLKGESLVQVASTGFEKVNTSNDLRFYEPGKAAQVKIAMQGDFRKLLKMNHPEGGKINTLERLNALLKDEVWIKKNSRLISITGVRIPVQGLNSMEYYEIAEFLPPSAGNTIVVPTEMVAKSGSDFDIDKLTMYYPAIFAGKVNPKNQKTEALTDQMLEAIFGESVDASEYVIKLDQSGANKFKNDIIKYAGEILLHPNNYTKLIRPIATDLVKENSEAYNKYKSEETLIEKSEVFNYSYNLKKQQENSVGKKALGISAKGNTYNTMFQKVEKGLSNDLAYGNGKFVSLEQAEADTESKYIKVSQSNIKLPFGKLGDLKDSEGLNLKSDIVSQIVNGHVDVASDSWIFDIGADNVMTPYLLNLIDMGVNYDYAVKFLNHPLVKEYLSKYKAINNSLLNKAISPKTFYDFTVIVDMFKKYIGDQYLDLITKKNKLGAPQLDKFGEVILRPSNEKNFMMVDSLGAKEVLSEKELNDPKSIKVLMEFIKTVYYFKPLKAVRMATDLDTKRAGTITEAGVEVSTVSNLLKNPVTSDLVKELLNRNVLGTFLSVKEFQTSGFKDLFGIRSTPEFVKSLLNLLEKDDVKYSDKDSKETLISRYTNGFINYYSDRIKFPYNSGNFNKVTQYKGLPVEFVKFEDADAGKVALVVDGVIKIDADTLKNKISGQATNLGISKEQFYSLLLEVQYIKATAPEVNAVEQALDNLYIKSTLIDMTSPRSIVQKFQEMVTDPSAQEALENFTIISDMMIYDFEDGKSVGIKTDKGNVEDFERYHSEIELLQKSTNKLVREFFTRLPQAIVSIEGFNGGRFSMIDVVPYTQIASQADNAAKSFSSLPTESKQIVLNEYSMEKFSFSQPLESTEIESSTEASLDIAKDSEVEEFIKKCKS